MLENDKSRALLSICLATLNIGTNLGGPYCDHQHPSFCDLDQGLQKPDPAADHGQILVQYCSASGEC